MQTTPLRFNPWSGAPLANNVTLADDMRRQSDRAWVYNPWLSAPALDNWAWLRNGDDVIGDPQGLLIVPPGERLLAAVRVEDADDEVAAGEELLRRAEAKEAAQQGPKLRPAIERVAAPSALNTQVGGGHYKDMKIQPVEYIHANGIPFIEGAVIKYVSRWRAKDGVKDLKKARHFLDLLIELEERNA